MLIIKITFTFLKWVFKGVDRAGFTIKMLYFSLNVLETTYYKEWNG